MKKWNEQNVLRLQTGGAGPTPQHLITICISAFNYEEYIEAALESARRQTHEDLEIIVVDDASGDDTRNVCSKWLIGNSDRFWRTQLLTNTRNQGPSLTRNLAFARASGDFVFVLDADNEVYPRAVAELYAVVRDGGFEAAYSQVEVFGSRSELGYADIFDAKRLRVGNYIDAMALISRKAWNEVDGFTHIELGWEDYDFWLKFIEKGFKAAYLPEILCRYRVHGTSRTDRDALPSHEALRRIMALRHPCSDPAERKS
jgi:glycosyltransferase involved in cell wall biosynthesis